MASRGENPGEEDTHPDRHRVAEILPAKVEVTEYRLGSSQYFWGIVVAGGFDTCNNNMAEQKIRPGVLWRNSSFGAQSEAGSRFVERMVLQKSFFC